MILYSKKDCPRCEVLEAKMNEKKIQYDIEKDADKMISMGIDRTPILEVDGKRMDFIEAVKYINGIEA